MKKKFIIILISFFTLCIGSVNGSNRNDSIISKYKVVNADCINTTILYTFTDSIMYIDEVGNEGFGYLYKFVNKNKKDYIYYYDDFEKIWYSVEVVLDKNKYIKRIKFRDCEVILQLLANS